MGKLVAAPDGTKGVKKVLIKSIEIIMIMIAIKKTIITIDK